MVKKTKAEIEAEDYEALKRKIRMEEAEIRIAHSPGGERFLDRIHEIGRPRPLKDEDPEGE